MPNQHSKASRDLSNLVVQLNSGKTRSGRPLSPEDLQALHERVMEKKQEVEELCVSRINEHTTHEAKGIIAANKASIQEGTQKSEAFFDTIGGPGTSTALRVQAAALNARAKIVEKSEKEASGASGKPATSPDEASSSAAAAESSGIQEAEGTGTKKKGGRAKAAPKAAAKTIAKTAAKEVERKRKEAEQEAKSDEKKTERERKEAEKQKERVAHINARKGS